ncbi:uncharacterized protein LOC142537715 [Primulina tabacum]|uniref:uncharacterized protein LOC142537715 n=1 Tax=Primulina tabacum TaxID=48773 RepID=UPI003F5A53E3
MDADHPLRPLPAAVDHRRSSPDVAAVAAGQPLLLPADHRSPAAADHPLPPPPPPPAGNHTADRPPPQQKWKEVLARIISDAVKKDVAIKAPSNRATQSGGEQEREKETREVEVRLEERHFKSTKIKDYDGRADPEENLTRFKNMVMLHCYADKIKCKVFITILVDSAQRWFEGLAPHSIQSFEDLHKIFLQQFSSSKKYKKTAFSIFDAKQNPEESFRAYIRSFNRVALDVPSCAPETKITTFTQRLREAKLFQSITKKVPGDFEDLLPMQIKDCMALKRSYVPPTVQGPNPPSKRLRLPPWTTRQPGPSAREDSRDALGRRKNAEPERMKSSPPALGVIKMIFGRSTDGDSNRAWKSKSRRECMQVEGVRRSEAVISFDPDDLKGVSLHHNNSLVIQAWVANYDIMRVFVDSDSSVNVIFKEALVQMDLQVYQLETVENALFGFAGHAVYPEGEIISFNSGQQGAEEDCYDHFHCCGSPIIL